MKLSHLLVMVFTSDTLSVVFSELLARAGVHGSSKELLLVSTIVAFPVAILIAWPISRLFRMSPLMTLAGPCPACHTRPGVWLGHPSGKTALHLSCGACGQQVELLLTRTPPRDVLSRVSQ